VNGRIIEMSRAFAFSGAAGTALVISLAPTRVLAQSAVPRLLDGTAVHLGILTPYTGGFGIAAIPTAPAPRKA
jgi:hypothetical protein